MPGAIPVTAPVVAPTVPSDGALLLHVPPLLISVNAVVSPVHTFVVPPIAAGSGLTVTACVT